ncbi:MAG: hypothetical protein K6F05_03175 [Succinivibrio sp.]|nr:hypothetical protein [Succinivibrio sp.]
MHKKIGIVYFSYINPDKDWKALIRGQLGDVKKSGILQQAALYIVVAIPNQAVPQAEIAAFYQSLGLDIQELEFHFDNKYEYYGIHKLWEIGLSATHQYLIYFHTKGMSYKAKDPLKLINGRNIREILLTYFTFRKYEQTLTYLEAHPQLPKAAFLAHQPDAQPCFSWFNFFWIRSDFVCKLEEPAQTSDRFYYEVWNSRLLPDYQESPSAIYCLYSKDLKSCSIDEATAILTRLRKLYKYTYPLSYLLLHLSYR